jgi:hypothetical protein
LAKRKNEKMWSASFTNDGGRSGIIPFDRADRAAANRPFSPGFKGEGVSMKAGVVGHVSRMKVIAYAHPHPLF